MNIRLLIATTFLLFSGYLSAQVQHSPQLYYARYEGSVGEDIQATANLMRTFNLVSGSYRMSKKQPGDDSVIKKRMPLVGSVSNDTLYLNEMGQNDDLIVGELTTGQLNGYWMLSESNPTPFKMNASYPLGSIAFDVSYLSSELRLDSSRADSPTASIELTLVYPKADQMSEGVADSVLGHINKSFFGHGLAPSQPDSLLVAFESEYYNNYKKQNQQWLESGGHSFSWEKSVSTSVVYNSDYLLCLEFERYAYTGGAHGMSNTAYQVLNLHDGSQLDYLDVFVDNADSMLTVLLTQQLKANLSMPSDSSLKNYGYFVDEIQPNHNFYLEESGIGFLFNSYEIAPYSFGTTNIFLNFNQLLPILADKTTVYEMARH